MSVCASPVGFLAGRVAIVSGSKRSISNIWCACTTFASLCCGLTTVSTLLLMGIEAAVVRWGQLLNHALFRIVPFEE